MSDTTKDYGKIMRRADGSYVINDGMYHVPNDLDFTPLWTDVDAYAIAHPDQVTMEPAISIDAVKDAKRAEINADFEAALIASLTMPSTSTPPSAIEVAVGAAGLAAVDADGPAYIMQTHSARRDELLSAVAAATTVVAVQDLVVSYAV